MTPNTPQPITYKDAGVDVDAGNAFVRNISSMVKSTFTPGVMDNFGGFGSLFRLDAERFRKPCLVSGTDGVGTKLQVAIMMDKHDTVGIDLVAMCVNDILVQGATPLFFLDYLACGKLSSIRSEDIVSGIAEGCRQASAALIGGETAEMPGFYPDGKYDLAGFVVGAVDEDRVITGSDISKSDIIIALPSSGIHSNGYSLVRRIFFTEHNKPLDWQPEILARPLGQTLLEPTRIYVRPILSLLETVAVQGMVHVTGGGLSENIPRILPPDLDAFIQTDALPTLPIFDLIQEMSHLPFAEMARTFNMGCGFLIVVRKEQVHEAMASLEQAGEQPVIVGEIVRGSGQVQYGG
ncbi:phosphoribosylformylglycinamidine cyclo-ligase [Desulfurispira natronophila]|uniref:Phosphoribosylformylglycinamidine cyclo-ligase n=1 Tax=Desulfurispira natronophila TaxID=682562 RepID=A0A7W7Y4W1_9BACT|nr:phosphoribosylformylglycinamidine cyclo-ligase [Desulfurispira natronophila]MBB5022136.1 phosphoribosylformylglycinamidine cyclo-ligase [Desulfurispira natronophila]